MWKLAECKRVADARRAQQKAEEEYLLRESARKEKLVERFVMRFHRRQEHRVLVTWSQKVAARMQARGHMKKLIQRLKHKSKAWGLLIWRRNVSLIIQTADLRKQCSYATACAKEMGNKRKHDKVVLLDLKKQLENLERLQSRIQYVAVLVNIVLIFGCLFSSLSPIRAT